MYSKTLEHDGLFFEDLGSSFTYTLKSHAPKHSDSSSTESIKQTSGTAQSQPATRSTTAPDDPITVISDDESDTKENISTMDELPKDLRSNPSSSRPVQEDSPHNAEIIIDDSDDEPLDKQAEEKKDVAKDDNDDDDDDDIIIVPPPAAAPQSTAPPSSAHSAHNKSQQETISFPSFADVWNLSLTPIAEIKQTKSRRGWTDVARKRFDELRGLPNSLLFKTFITISLSFSI